MEDRLRALELEVAKAEARAGVTMKALIIGGGVLLGLWGYSNFLTIPAEAKKSLESSSFEKVLADAEAAGKGLKLNEEKATDLVQRLQNLDSSSLRNAVVAFHSESCPNGWSAYEPADGRYLVGSSLGKSIGSVVGTRLSDRENRPAGRHDHKYDGFTLGGDAPDKNNAIAWGGRHGALRKFLPNENTTSSGDVDGTNAPYVQLLFCKPN